MPTRCFWPPGDAGSGHDRRRSSSTLSSSRSTSLAVSGLHLLTPEQSLGILADGHPRVEEDAGSWNTMPAFFGGCHVTLRPGDVLAGHGESSPVIGSSPMAARPSGLPDPDSPRGRRPHRRVHLGTVCRGAEGRRVGFRWPVDPLTSSNSRLPRADKTTRADSRQRQTNLDAATGAASSPASRPPRLRST
jgi:hypothetical protein